MPGIQSTKLMCRSEPLRCELLYTLASMSENRAMQNCAHSQRHIPLLARSDVAVSTHQSTRKIDASASNVRAVEPLRPGESEQTL
jgi:hypothetical protein